MENNRNKYRSVIVLLLIIGLLFAMGPLVLAVTYSATYSYSGDDFTATIPMNKSLGDRVNLSTVIIYKSGIPNVNATATAILANQNDVVITFHPKQDVPGSKDDTLTTTGDLNPTLYFPKDSFIATGNKP